MDRSGKESHRRLLNRIRTGLANKSQRTALYSGTEAGTEAAQKAYAQMPGGEDLPFEARELKASAIDQLDANLARFTEAAKLNGINVHMAADAASAVRLIIDLARKANAKLIVKTKSMTGEEIDLRQHLEREGFEVVETDLGERIVQLANQRPAHMTAPAIHMTVQQVTELLSKNLRREVPPDPEQITAMARESLREKFLNADLGITGANFVIADSGAIVLVTNEGNARLVTALPRVTIAVAGVEKIVANMSDTFTLLQALIMSGAGRKLTSYVTILRGGSKLAQNGRLQEQHIVLLDNGRSKMRSSPVFREALYCLRCGACNDICPTFRLFGGHVFGHIYTGPIGVPWTKYTTTSDQAGSFAPLCISCGLCQNACPVRIDIPFLIAKVKEEYSEKHGQLRINRTLCDYESLVRLASATAPISNFLLRQRAIRASLQSLLGIDARKPFPHFTRHTFTKWFRSHASKGTRTVAYFVDSFADMCEPEIGRAVVGILELNGCKVTLPMQVGSGMPSFLYGDMERTQRAAEFNVHHLAEAVRTGCEVVSSEPTATYCLKELYPHLLQSSDAKLVASHSHDLFDFLLSLHKDGKLNLQASGAFEEPIVYYPPCHTRSVYGRSYSLEAMRLAGINAEPVRYSTCCGIAGTFGFKKGPEGFDVSMAIGETLFQRLRETKPSIVVTESSVCKMHIEHGTSLPVIHPAVLLWNLYQGSRKPLIPTNDGC